MNGRKKESILTRINTCLSKLVNTETLKQIMNSGLLMVYCRLLYNSLSLQTYKLLARSLTNAHSLTHKRFLLKYIRFAGWKTRGSQRTGSRIVLNYLFHHNWTTFWAVMYAVHKWVMTEHSQTRNFAIKKSLCPEFCEKTWLRI